MLAKRIIPCLDVHAGRVVKGVNFINLKDAGEPVEVAKVYDEAGADELVFLDITASSDARNIVLDMVRRVAESVFIPFTVGGGTIDRLGGLVALGDAGQGLVDLGIRHRGGVAHHHCLGAPEFAALFARAGLRVARILRTPGLHALIEAVAA